ncbi:MAG: phosphopantothenoylcysteine decarboxylase, partial [Verrucomicrobiota bacterium]
REPIDPVRFLSNRSSGKMGYAIAEAAVTADHEVTLVTGPTCLPIPDGVSCHEVETASQMYDIVERLIPNYEVAIFCAAVADYRITEPSPDKIKKSEEELTLKLVRNPDILGSVRDAFHFSGIVVGFAAETTDLEIHAQTKLERKGCDLVVANDVSRSDIGFDQSDNEVLLIRRDGSTRLVDRTSKKEVAQVVLQEIQSLIG